MNYFVSTEPDITEDLPHNLGTGPSTSRPAPPGWDVSFGQYGFLLRPSLNTPYQRSTERQNKEQIDTSDLAGEQSFGGLWLRSQSTWDTGAGITWYEPKEDGTQGRFASSLSIDVWTPGEFRLLKAMEPVEPAAGSEAWVATLNDTDGRGFIEFRGESARRFTDAGVLNTSSTGSSGTEFSGPAVVGASAWAGSNVGIWRYTPGSPDLSLVISHANTYRSFVWWGKNRLIVAWGPTLYSVPLTATGTLLSEGTVLYTHPDVLWQWTGVCEASRALLASGYSSGESGIFRMPLTDDEDGNPQIGPGSLVGPMPNGEVITTIGSYLGTVMVVGTTAGVRIAQLSSDGDVSLGPLTIVTDTPAQDVVFRDRFAYVPFSRGLPGGVSGCARIDLSVPIGDTGRYAWATDAKVPSGVDQDTVSIALLDDRVVLTNIDGTYVQSATAYESEGYLDTGRIRFHTAEQKAFRSVRLSALINHGRISLTAIDPTTNETSIIAIDETVTTSGDIPIRIPQRPLNQYISLRVYLYASGEALESSPTVEGLVLKAQPAASRVRLYQYPLQIADNEIDRYGQTHIGQGTARLLALEAAEEAGIPLTIVDNRSGETFTGQIDSVDFTATSPPDKGSNGYAGVAVVVVRRL